MGMKLPHLIPFFSIIVTPILAQDDPLEMTFLPDGQAQVWWPSELNGRRLQISRDLDQWSTVNDRPFLSDVQFWHQFPDTETRQFYRLVEGDPYVGSVPEASDSEI